MKVLTIILLAGLVCFTQSVSMKRYRKALKKDSVLKKLFEEKYGDKGYSDDEVAERMAYFKEALQFVVDQNDDDSVTWESDVTVFGDLSEDEREGVLMKIYEADSAWDPDNIPIAIGDNGVSAVDWVGDGYVRGARNQMDGDNEDCRACWAFAAIAALEGRYQVVTNDSVEFSEQELVDCVYWTEGREEDGCYGGNMNDAYDYIKTFGRLASRGSAPYTATDPEGCGYSGWDNGLTGAHVTGWTLLEASDQAHIEALEGGPVSCGVQTTASFLYYSSGVFKDTTCSTLIPNHAVAMVGYDASSFRIKNSWGETWGDDGFMSVARGHHGCGLIFYTIVPNFVRGAPTTTDPSEPTACEDQWTFCSYYKDYCQYYEQYCPKTCEVC